MNLEKQKQLVNDLISLGKDKTIKDFLRIKRDLDIQRMAGIKSNQNAIENLRPEAK